MLNLFVEAEITTAEETRLDELEGVISRGLKTFVDVGAALLEIRDTRLYRQSYGTFEDYCRERWGMQRAHAYRLIEAASVISDLSPMGDILPMSERQARPLTSLPKEDLPVVWQQVVETAPESGITAAHVQSVVDAYQDKRPVSYHISDDSYDWYTPVEYIEAARGLMGRIDLDPASSDEAQKVIQAAEYYTKEDNGLLYQWAGTVWLNPPYNMPLIEQFVDKVIDEYERGLVVRAVVLTNNSTDTGWFHKLLKYPVCFTKGRIKFWNGDEILAARQGQAIFYLGEDNNRFAELFSSFGVVMTRL